MEPSRGGTNPPLNDELFAHGYDFQFFQAIRLLGWIFPLRQSIGREASPMDEIVRLKAHLSLAFPPSAIHQIDNNAEGGPPLMTVAFLGLTGPQGILPESYTEDLIARRMKKDRSTAAFFDIFNHRLLCLFYRAWEKHRFFISYERKQVSPASAREEGFTSYLFDLIGMGTGGLRSRLGIRAETLLLYAGLLAQRPHSASALAGILRDYFRVSVQIEQFRGKWFSLEDDSLTYLQTGRGQNQLGFGAIAGDAIWNPQARFRVRLGPLTYARFTAFLPGGKALSEARELIRFFVGKALKFDFQLVLLAAEVPECRATDELERSPRLGLTSWLERQDIPFNASDLVLDGARIAA